ncbi:MAG: YfdX family protein [Bacteroidales bacterium]|nr:YfdX family protein [Bacteroidales bacterium]
MKKRSIFLWIFLGLFFFSSCGQTTNSEEKGESENVAPDNVKIENAVTDSLYAAIYRQINNTVSKRKDSIINEAFTTASETNKIFKLINEHKTKEAVNAGNELIGKLEVLLANNPDDNLILADVSFKKNEVMTDMGTVKNIVKSAEKAMDKGYYQDASDLLKNLKSEIIISDFYIPLATYPDAIKQAIIFLENNKPEDAKLVLQQLPASVVEVKTILPLPVLKAEQMIIMAKKIDADNHKNSEKVMTLLDAADYQLKFAKAMGYGNKDKDFKALSASIKKLKESVKSKSDSQSEFDSLKNDIIKFKERLFLKTDKTKVK